MQRVVINAVQDRFAAAEMIRNILDVGGTEHTGRKVETRNLYADPVTSAK